MDKVKTIQESKREQWEDFREYILYEIYKMDSVMMFSNGEAPEWWNEMMEVNDLIKHHKNKNKPFIRFTE